MFCDCCGPDHCHLSGSTFSGAWTCHASAGSKSGEPRRELTRDHGGRRRGSAPTPPEEILHLYLVDYGCRYLVYGDACAHTRIQMCILHVYIYI